MKKLFAAIGLLVCLFSVKIFSQSAPERDFQVWTETQFLFPVIKKKNKNNEEVEKLAFFISGTLRGGINLSQFIDERIHAGFEFYPNKSWTISPSYIYRAGQPYKNRKEYEHRIRFDVSGEKKWTSFSVKNRSRIEYRIRHSRGDTVRFRNKIQVKFPVKRGGKEIFAPFAADEPFYDFREKHWIRNEFSAGFSRKLSSTTSGDFYYMLQNNRGNSFKYVNILGMSLKVKID